MPKIYNAPPGFEMNPAGMAKECRELRRWKSTHAPRLDALAGMLQGAQLGAAAGLEARQTLASERAANAALTDEVEALRAEVAVLRDANARWQQGPWIGRCQACGHEHEAPNV